MTNSFFGNILHQVYFVFDRMKEVEKGDAPDLLLFYGKHSYSLILLPDVTRDSYG